MRDKILLGVGGTGAKVVEAILHCCAAGLGPTQLMVGFIDQDKSNGNVSRANRTLARYMDARQNWRGGGPHYFEESEFLATQVSTFKRSLWTPHPDDNSSLATALGDLGDDQRLFDLLFTRQEQQLKLDIGYQARAHVGSAAITAAIRNKKDPFWIDVVNKLSKAEGGEGVDFLLVGSAFGGTGAAGFPTIARLLRRILEKKGIKHKARLGGVLMLPYFAFSPPKPGSTVARADELLPQTKAALHYYHDLFERDPVFDATYLVGWNSKFDLGYHNPGKGGQCNPALAPELLAALAGCRFLAERDPQATLDDRAIFASARHEEHALNWNDLPPVRDGSGNTAYAKLGQLIRFAAAWKHWKPILNRESGSWRDSFRKRAWFKAFGLNTIDTTQESLAKAVTSMTEYLHMFVEWALTIQLLSKESGAKEEMRFGLWNMRGFLLDEPYRKDDTSPLTVPVAPSLEEGVYAQLFEAAVMPVSGETQLTTAAHLMEQLCEPQPKNQNKGLGGIVAAMHAHSAIAAVPSEARA